MNPDRSLGERLAGLVLSDPPANPTQVVMDWGARQSPPVTDPQQALRAYQAAARSGRATAGDLIRSRLLDPDGARDVLTVVNARGIPTNLRLWALEQVADRLEPRDVADLARTTARQHSTVVHRARDQLVRLNTAEAMYALRKVLGRRDDAAGRLAREAGAAMAEELAAVRALRTGAADPEIGGEDLLYAALSIPRGDAASATESDDLRMVLELVADDIDATLQDAGRTAAGLNDYQQLLRDDLHSFVLSWRLAREQQLEHRALDTLLRREHLEEVEPVLRLAAPEVTAAAARRALDPARRQGRYRFQAVGVVRALAARADARVAVLAELASLLLDDDVELRRLAVEALAQDREELDLRQRRQVLAGFASLPPDQRASIASQLGSFASEATQLGDVEALAAWISGATKEDAAGRVRVALDALRDRQIAVDDHIRIARATLDAWKRLPDDCARGGLERELFASVVGGMVSAPSPQDTLQVLLDIPGMSRVAARAVELGDFEMWPPQARRVMARTLVATSDAEWLLRIVGASATHIEALEDALAATADESIQAWDTLSEAADVYGRRLLLRARLRALRRVTRELARGEAAQREASVEALVARRQAVLGALDESQDAGVGNQALLEQFGIIREAVGLLGATDEPSAGSTEVERWRAEKAEATVGVTGTDEGLRVDEAGPSVIALMLDADRRAHGREASKRSRAAYRREVKRLVEGLVVGGYAPGDPGWPELARALKGRGELARLVWAAWAATVGDVQAEVVRRLSSPATAPEQALALDALLRVAPTEQLDAVISALDSEQITIASKTIGRLLQAAVRARNTVQAQVERQEQEAGRRIAGELRLPFRSIESMVFGYFRLRAVLDAAGWRQIAAKLGDSLTREELHPDKHEIRGDVDAHVFIVRSLGIEVDGQPVERAIVEGISAQ